MGQARRNLGAIDVMIGEISDEQGRGLFARSLADAIGQIDDALVRPRTPTADYQFGYDDFGRMASASLNGSSLGTYASNGFDQRAVKYAASNSDFIYDRAGHTIAEANDATGAPIREYIWMDEMPVAMVDDTGASPVVYDVHSAHLGRPQKLTDQSANLVWDAVVEFGFAEADLRNWRLFELATAK